MLSLHLSCVSNYKLQSIFSQLLFEASFWVKTQSTEPKKMSNVKFYHKKLKFFFLVPFETMVIMTHYSFLTHMNVNKLKLKIHLIQF
jgi:hypothetical protein